MSTWSLTFQQRVLSDSRVTNISKSFTYKMAAKPTWHRHRTKLCHCHPMCSPLPARPSVCLFVFVCHKSGVRNSWVNWASFGWAGFGMGDSFHLSTLCRQEIRVSPKLCPKLWTLKISPWKVDLVINKTYLYGRACWRHLRLSTHHGCLLTRRSAVIPYTSICCATCSCCYEAVDNSSTRGDFSTDMTSRGQSSVAELIVLLVGTLWAPVSTVVVWRCDDVLTVCVCVWTADERESVQKKTFAKWVNSHLMRVNCSIQDLYVDLRDGKMLIKLLEVLSGERLVRWCSCCCCWWWWW